MSQKEQEVINIERSASRLQRVIQVSECDDILLSIQNEVKKKIFTPHLLAMVKDSVNYFPRDATKDIVSYRYKIHVLYSGLIVLNHIIKEGYYII